MTVSELPPELLYNILGDVVAEYIDLAITSPSTVRLPTPNSAGDVMFTPGHVDGRHSLQLEFTQNLVDGDSADTLPTTRRTLRSHKSLDHFITWTAKESLEPLPKNTIISLLLVSRRWKEVLVKVLEDSLGQHKNARDRWFILKELRREFRRTRTAHLARFPVKLKTTTRTPLIMGYIRLCQAQWLLKDVNDLVFAPQKYSREHTAYKLQSQLRADFTKLIPQPVLCGRVNARMCLARLRLTYIKRLAVISHEMSKALLDILSSMAIQDREERFEKFDTLRATTDRFVSFETHCRAVVKQHGPSMALNFEVFPSHAIKFSEITTFLEVLANIQRDTISDDSVWREEMKDFENWAKLKRREWKTMSEKNPDYDEIDWSARIFG